MTVVIEIMKTAEFYRTQTGITDNMKMTSSLDGLFCESCCNCRMRWTGERLDTNRTRDGTKCSARECN